MSESLARAIEHADRHETEADYWKEVIDNNRERIELLSVNATARPDPFTGTMGRELERRIDTLERHTDKVIWVNDRVKDIDERLTNTEKHYRDSIMPLIRSMQSNDKAFDGSHNVNRNIELNAKASD